ncbi:hypothetical protein C4544_01585 [candidate division WS5 bacterium]|uniref:Uncharacterized protein n=1 Tax=candidate division WS5 bacterium TaxID=2093353 RepID=A0A419DFG8_9BACT|nr:MAG: hypothetical protein C4544_01585 [candidate division WS5 bacterium]
MLESMVGIILIVIFIYAGGVAKFAGQAQAWNIRQLLIGGAYNTARPVIVTAISGTIATILGNSLPETIRPSAIFIVSIIACTAMLLEVVIMVYAMITGKERPELPYNA